jgi:cyclic pyranopterin phosphate synthase
LTISGGEPFLRKDLPEIINAAKTAFGFKYISLATNGLLVREETLQALRNSVDIIWVSVDGYDADHSTYIRGNANFKLIMRNVDLIRRSGVPVGILPTLHSKNMR